MVQIDQILARMNLKEKIAFCTGVDFWHTKALPEYHVPQMMMSDGPHGLRCQKGKNDMIGIRQSQPATCFPAAVSRFCIHAGKTAMPCVRLCAHRNLRQFSQLL